MFNQGRINIHIEHKTKPNDSLVVSSNICIIAVSELLKYRYIAVIGLGQFGYQVALSMTQKEFDVLAVDINPDLVDEIKDMMASEISNLDDKRIKEVRTSGATEGYWVWMSKDFVESNKIKKKFDEYRVKSKAMHTKREYDGLAKLVSKKSKVTPATESKAEVSNHEGL